MRSKKKMPKEIILEDGTRETVYGEDEVKEFQTAAEAAKEQFSKLKTEMGVQEGETIEQKLAELKENANPNFAKFRTKFNAMERELKNAGKELDDLGNVITTKPVSMEEINKATEIAVDRALQGKQKEAVLSQFEGEDRKLFEHYFDKFNAAGFDFKDTVRLATNEAFPGRQIDPIRSSVISGPGEAPRFAPPAKQSYSETDEGKSILNQIVPPTK